MVKQSTAATSITAGITTLIPSTRRIKVSSKERKKIGISTKKEYTETTLRFATRSKIFVKKEEYKVIYINIPYLTKIILIKNNYNINTNTATIKNIKTIKLQYIILLQPLTIKLINIKKILSKHNLPNSLAIATRAERTKTHITSLAFANQKKIRIYTRKTKILPIEQTEDNHTNYSLRSIIWNIGGKHYTISKHIVSKLKPTIFPSKIKLRTRKHMEGILHELLTHLARLPSDANSTIHMSINSNLASANIITSLILEKMKKNTYNIIKQFLIVSSHQNYNVIHILKQLHVNKSTKETGLIQTILGSNSSGNNRNHINPILEKLIENTFIKIEKYIMQITEMESQIVIIKELIENIDIIPITKAIRSKIFERYGEEVLSESWRL